MSATDANTQTLTGSALVTADNVDLSNCDREQVQFAGAIQPHGALPVVQEPELRILQVGANTSEVLGQTPERLRGGALSTLLGDAQIQTLREQLVRESLDDIPLQVLHAQLPGRRQPLAPGPRFFMCATTGLASPPKISRRFFRFSTVCMSVTRTAAARAWD